MQPTFTMNFEIGEKIKPIQSDDVFKQITECNDHIVVEPPEKTVSVCFLIISKVSVTVSILSFLIIVLKAKFALQGPMSCQKISSRTV
jgi:hypothetical protein